MLTLLVSFGKSLDSYKLKGRGSEDINQEDWVFVGAEVPEEDRFLEIENDVSNEKDPSQRVSQAEITFMNTKINGLYPLTWAIKRKYEESVLALLRAGAKVTLFDIIYAQYLSDSTRKAVENIALSAGSRIENLELK